MILKNTATFEVLFIVSLFCAWNITTVEIKCLLSVILVLVLVLRNLVLFTSLVEVHTKSLIKHKNKHRSNFVTWRYKFAKKYVRVFFRVVFKLGKSSRNFDIRSSLQLCPAHCSAGRKVGAGIFYLESDGGCTVPTDIMDT